MKHTHDTLNELIALAQCQSALRDDLLAQQRTLAHVVSTASPQPFVRVERLARAVAMVMLMVGPPSLASACTPVPDGRDMHTESDRTQIVDDAHQIIRNL